ncbi:MAG: hypothetical protein NTX45_07940 [Proteobacteria bacterium]|nr:hypothetical protein [Pseudomonadota bacterium]
MLSNTNCLIPIAQNHIGQLDLLHRLYVIIHISEESDDTEIRRRLVEHYASNDVPSVEAVGQTLSLSANSANILAGSAVPSPVVIGICEGAVCPAISAAVFPFGQSVDTDLVR